VAGKIPLFGECGNELSESESSLKKKAENGTKTVNFF
jgi:hypothetical protein